jgi:hypothetical protein
MRYRVVTKLSAFRFFVENPPVTKQQAATSFTPKISKNLTAKVPVAALKLAFLLTAY